jgi:hypothetical protein
MLRILIALAILMALLILGLVVPAPANAILGDNATGAGFYLSNWGHSPMPLVQFNSHGIGRYLFFKR